MFKFLKTNFEPQRTSSSQKRPIPHQKNRLSRRSVLLDDGEQPRRFLFTFASFIFRLVE